MDKCSHVKKLRVEPNHSVYNPHKWLCEVCGTTESVWACLSCTNVACGRYNEEHAVKHYKESHHPLAIEVNDRYVFCYECDDYILNDNAPGDLKLLRTTLDAITRQTLYESQTRSGRRLLRALSVDTGEQIKHRRQDHLTWEDKGYTALVHRRLVLLSKVFLSWKQLVHGEKVTGRRPKERRPKRAPSDEPTASPRPEETEESSEAKKPRRDGCQLSEAKRRWTLLTPGVTGLRNLGNTCYMNAILQVLGHLHRFRECFLHLELDLRPLTKSQSVGTRRQVEYLRQTTMECFEEVQKSGTGFKAKGRILRQPGTSTGGLSGGSGESVDAAQPRDLRNADNTFPLCHELHALYRVMWSGKWAIVSPHAILGCIWKLIPSFRGYSQQDAQEFLCEFLDKVHSELQCLVPSPVAMTTDDGESIPTKDIVTRSFEGGLVSQVLCLHCMNKSNTFEPLGDMSLEFPERYQFSEGRTSLSEASCHLTEMLAKFTEREHLGAVYACERCNRLRRGSARKPELRTEASKRLLLTKLPLVLRLHLKRFRWSGRNHREKINVHVNFEEELNTRPYCYVAKEDERRLTNDDFLYDLTAVVTHHGKGFGSGHYTAHCWNDGGGFWVHCNDARLELCSVEDVTASQAYILLYTKRTTTVAKMGQMKGTSTDGDAAGDDETDGPRRVIRKRRITL